MEFQFGTNWARFSEAAGGIIGQTLAMEGMFSFFLESSFLALFLFGEKRLGPRGHWWAAFLVFLGAWLSGWFIVATNAWMQHPVGYDAEEYARSGTLVLESWTALFTNPWLVWQYLHTMIAAVVTACFVVAGIGAYYVLADRHAEHGRTFLRVAVPVGLVATILVAFPTGDMQAKNVYEHQPVTFAAMEGHFETKQGASLVLIGQPDMDALALDNPIELPGVLSFLTHRRWTSEIRGLTTFPRDTWPDNVPLLYYAYHIMAGLGTIFIAAMVVAAWKLVRGTLLHSRATLWVLLLLVPFPYIANLTGWMTAELGRQPWLIHRMMRTADGFSENVSEGNALFTLLGFMGLYAVMSLLFAVLVGRTIARGPDDAGPEAHGYAGE
jgi:cytochrome d ubiquinol oxidase subunit I